MIVVRTSTKAVYLLEAGKLVVVRGSGWLTQKLPVVHVDEQTWANLVTAYGAVVGTP